MRHMMTTYTTFSVSLEKGDRLRKLAALDGCTHTSLLGKLIDDYAERRGLDTKCNAVRVAYNEARKTYSTELFGAFVFELTKQGTLDLAESLAKIATEGGSMMGIDKEFYFMIERRGPGVTLTVPHAVSRLSDKPVPMKKTMSRDEAKEIATAIRDAEALAL